MDNQYASQPIAPQRQAPAPQGPAKKQSSPLLPVLVLAVVIIVASLLPIFLQSRAAKEQQKRQDTTNETLKKMQTSNELTASYQSTVKADRYQGVFLKGGSVYFGKITKMDAAFVTLEDIYYLRSGKDVQGDTTASQDMSLAKLGNELHGPEDKMTIATSDVSFWENLKADGQVAKAIAEFKKNQ